MAIIHVDASALTDAAARLADAGHSLSEAVGVGVQAGAQAFAIAAKATAQPPVTWGKSVAAGTRAIKTSETSAVVTMPGSWKHPTYGHKPWVSQPVKTDALDAVWASTQDEIERAIDDAVSAAIDSLLGI